jgi:hypothetical protein
VLLGHACLSWGVVALFGRYGKHYERQRHTGIGRSAPRAGEALSPNRGTPGFPCFDDRSADTRCGADLLRFES